MQREYFMFPAKQIKIKKLNWQYTISWFKLDQQNYYRILILKQGAF